MDKDQEIDKLKSLLRRSMEWNWIDWDEEKEEFGDDAGTFMPGLYALEKEIIEAICVNKGTERA